MRRVVITGLGAITPIGNNVEEFWNGIKEGKCGINKITAFDTTDFKVKLAAEVKGYNPEEYFDRKEAKRLDKFSQYAMIAAREVAELIYFLGSEKSSYITGQVINVDGGMVM